jgi:hypothetical protein
MQQLQILRGFPRVLLIFFRCKSTENLGFSGQKPRYQSDQINAKLSKAKSISLFKWLLNIIGRLLPRDWAEKSEQWLTSREDNGPLQQNRKASVNHRDDCHQKG